MNKQEYYSGIDWEAPLSRDHIAKIYGYSLYDKQYLVKVMSEYEKHGRTGVKYVYRLYVNLEEQHRKQELIPISQELVKRIDAEYERKVKEYEWKKLNVQKQKFLQSRSDEELRQMLRKKRF